MNKKRNVIIGMLGVDLDNGKFARRWEKWRPTISLCQQKSLPIDRFELLCQPDFAELAETIAADIAQVSMTTEVNKVKIEFDDPRDFEQVYGALHDFAQKYPFDTDNEEYLIHITTGTHVAQICMFLLTESHYFPAKLVQSFPVPKSKKKGTGSYKIIDLDLSKYARLASRFEESIKEGAELLKSGIETRNSTFNNIIADILHVAVSSTDPILLMGPTGTGKTQMAEQIYRLKEARRKTNGEFVEINCATIKGDGAMSVLFGHVRGAFTGAEKERAGVLKKADKGILFLDEIGELGLDEQSMLLRALEKKSFFPLGSDTKVNSDFQLITGTNRDLFSQVKTGQFREDLLARIKMWTFHLPPLKERPEDIEPNIDYELKQYNRRAKTKIVFNKDARIRFIRFAVSQEATWNANFRDLNAAISRMATMSKGGRITEEVIDNEIRRLKSDWSAESGTGSNKILELLFGKEKLEKMDVFDQVTLAGVIEKCRAERTLSGAGRLLFAASRGRKRVQNDADRLSKYLKAFGLNWAEVRARIDQDETGNSVL